MAELTTARARRALEIALYAPLGLLGYLRDATPTLLTVLVARGRGEVDRARSDIGRQVRHARSYGDAVIAFGLKGRAGEPDAPDVTSPSPDRAENDAGPARERPRSVEAAAVDDSEESPAGGAGSTHLAIPAYDSLSASQVVERLAGLDPAQLDAVRSYEAETRRRRTILGKIDQLTA